MEFLEKLIARGDAAPALKVGTLSKLAAQVRSDEMILLCVADMSSEEAGFATDLLMRALRCADAIVSKIETEEVARSFFQGEPRDVLLYEALFFCLHGLSARLRRVVPADRVEASPHFAGLAVTAATELGRQHLDAFDASQHRLERAKAYLPHVDSIKDMSGCLVDILLSGAGSIVPDPRETSTWEANVAIEVGLRGVVRAIATTTFRSETEQLIKRYARRFDCVRFDSNERQ